MSRPVMSITQVTEYIRTMIDSDQLMMGLAVCGEISNYKIYPSGHHYFTLKDENASLKCVMFRSSTVRLRFKPENGMRVIAMGKISVYPRDGVYQLYCSAMTVDGIGDLHVAFEQLKNKLEAEGLFDPAHKRSIPQMPEKVGIITSSAGAALHDMLRIINDRFPLTQICLIPVRVQGESAPLEIAAAIKLANQHKLANVLIVGRGGGSIEDLWAFNDERVARAIYASSIPVISAVGHEPDVTISDYVADLRAATPSNAAELVVPDKASLQLRLDKQQKIITNILMQRIKAAKDHLLILSSGSVLKSPQHSINLKRNALLHLCNRLIGAQTHQLDLNKRKFVDLTARLDAMSPLKVLQRGYAVVKAEDDMIIRSVKQVKTGDPISISVSDGNFNAIVQSFEEASK